jgi:hypothetical protein
MHPLIEPIIPPIMLPIIEGIIHIIRTHKTRMAPAMIDTIATMLCALLLDIYRSPFPNAASKLNFIGLLMKSFDLGLTLK